MMQAIHVIDRRRKELGMSTAELCRIAHVVESTYRNMVSGRSMNEPFPTIRALALAVNMTLDELVTLMDDEASPKTMDALNKIAQTPATTQEVDTGFTVLARTMENNAAAYHTDLKLICEQYDRLIESKDAQYEHGYKTLVKALLILAVLCAALIAALCVSFAI